MQAAILPFPHGTKLFAFKNTYVIAIPHLCAINHLQYFKSNIDIMIKRSMAKENGTVPVNQLPSLKLGRDSYGSKALCKLINVNM